jgi:hypothetical protein
MVDLVEWSFLPLLLLVKNVKGILHFCESRSLSVEVLSTSFGTLDYGLPSQNGFLFLPEPLNLLLDSG